MFGADHRKAFWLTKEPETFEDFYEKEWMKATKIVKKLKGVERRVCKHCLVRIVCSDPCENLTRDSKKKFGNRDADRSAKNLIKEKMRHRLSDNQNKILWNGVWRKTHDRKWWDPMHGEWDG